MEKILKYNNRKLYSTTLSKYVKLDYIIDLVRLDSKFEVISHDSGENLTDAVLKSAMVKMSDKLSITDLARLIKGA